MSSADADSLKDLKGGTLSVAIANILRSRILDGTLAQGAPIKEAALGRELRVSRSPLHDAVLQLNLEGLVVPTQRRSPRVVEFDRTDLVHLNELREPIAIAVARLAAERADRGDLAALERLAERIRAGLEHPELPYPHETDFHEVLARAAKSPRLAEVSEMLERQLRLARLRSGDTPERAQHALREHLDIYEAVAARDADAAAEAMSRHVAAAAASFLAHADSET